MNKGNTTRFNESGQSESSPKAIPHDKYLAKIFEHEYDAILATDINHNVRAWNLAAEKMFGYTAEEVLGKTVSDFVKVNEEVRNLWREAVLKNGEWNGEVDIINKEGKLLKTIYSMSTITDEEGNITDFIATIKDITEIVELKEDLKKMNLTLQYQVKEKTALITEILERISDGFAAFDNDLNIIYLSNYFEPLFCKPVADLIGTNLINDHTDNKGLDVIKKILLNKVICQKEIFSKEYDNRWFNISFYPSSTGCSLFMRDITDKKIAEQNLKQSEQLYSALFENAKDLIGIVNDKSEVLKVNQSIETFLGYTKEEVFKLPLSEFVFPEDVIKFSYDLSKIPKVGSLVIETKYKTKQGKKKYGELNASRLPDGTYMGVIRDITERKKIELELKQSLSLNLSILESIHNGILVVDQNGNIVSSNERFAKMWQIPDAILNSNNDKFLLEFILDQLTDPDEFRSKVSKLYTNPEATSFDEINFKDGRVFERVSKPILLQGKPFARVWSFFDITLRKNAEAEKSFQLLRYRSLMQTSQDAIHIIDENGKLIEWNMAFFEQLGYTELETSGLHIWDWDAQWDKPTLKKIIKETTEVGRSFETVFKLKDGSLRNMDIKFHQILFNDTKYYYGSARDITARKESEEALRLSESKLRNILDSSFDAIGVHYNGIWEMCNLAAVKLFGYETIDELIGTPFLNVIATGEHKSFKNFVNKREKHIEAPSKYVTRGLKSDGTEFDLEISLSDFSQDNKKHFMVILRDITLQTTHDRKMFLLNKELRELANHLQTVREEERSFIAKEIHDELSQNLVALSMNASYLKSKLNKDENKNILDDQIEMANELVNTSRILFNSLHPSMLEEIGLEAAIDWYAKSKLKLTSIHFILQSIGSINLDRNLKHINLVLFRIFQETLTNILRHSKANNISVEIHKTDENLKLQIKDDGVGFDHGKIDSILHHGLLIIRERVLSVNGEFKIDSIIGKGTTLSVNVPIEMVV